MKESRCAKVQTVVKEALRAMVGCKIHDMTQPVAALWREMNVASICAVAAGSRARAIKKFPGLKTWIGTLGQYNHTSRRQAWMASSRRWLRTLENRHQRVIDGEGDGDDEEKGGVDISGWCTMGGI